MAKLSKQYYTNSNGERKLNCYHINIAKDIVKEANIKDTDETKIYAKHGKIIIEKKG